MRGGGLHVYWPDTNDYDYDYNPLISMDGRPVSVVKNPRIGPNRRNGINQTADVDFIFAIFANLSRLNSSSHAKT